MNKRAKLPNADVLFGNTSSAEQHESLISKNQDVKQLKQQDIKILKHLDSKIEKQKKSKPAKKQNIMTTCYFSSETIKEIEKAKVKLLIDHDLKTTKSQIIEAAVKNMLTDFDQLSNLLSQSKN